VNVNLALGHSTVHSTPQLIHGQLWVILLNFMQHVDKQIKMSRFSLAFDGMMLLTLLALFAQLAAASEVGFMDSISNRLRAGVAPWEAASLASSSDYDQYKDFVLPREAALWRVCVL